MSARHPIALRLALLAGSGLALSLAFSPFPLRFLSLVALIPLLWIIETESPARVFRYGSFFGATFAMFHLWWFWTLVVPVEPVTRVLLDIGVVLLFGVLGLIVGLFALAAKKLGIWWSPLIWAALEWLRSQSDMGFPWGLLGTSLTPYVPLIQSASIIGVYGLSALVVLINLLTWRCIAGARRALFVPLLAVSVLAPLAFGLARLRPAETWFRVGIVQPNVSPLEKGEASVRETTWADMLRMSHEAVAQGASLLVYPETSSLVDIERPSAFRDSLQQMADASGTYILTGSPAFHATEYLNATALIEPHRTLNQLYYKLHLAPFSERFPFVRSVPFLRNIMTRDMGDAGNGVEFKVFSAALASQGSGGHGSMGSGQNPGTPEPCKTETLKPETLKPSSPVHFCTPICFEGIFPELTRQFADRGAELIVNVTNDGWFRKTPGPYQHCELMIMRAVENGLPFVRSANNGISLVADPYGRVLKQTPLFVATSLVQDVPKPLAPTFYRRNGDQFAYASLLLTAILTLVRLARAIFRRRPRPLPPSP
jgi:apolipoprotein N-acyltransferase